MAFPVHRSRRLRVSPGMRALVRETTLSPADFVMPYFVRPGKGVKKPIGSMPGHFQYSVDELAKAVPEVESLGVPAVLLFGIPDRKDEHASGAYAALYDEDPQKVQELTALVSRARDLGAIPHLIENLNHEDRYVRLMTHIALNTITDNRVVIPYRWDLSEAVRKQGQKDWREWYDKEGKSLMTPPDEPRKG